MKYQIKFDSDIQGTPCQIYVRYTEYEPPDPLADEECFYRGGYTVEFDVFRDGQQDNTLYNKMTEDDESRITWEALDLMGYAES